MRKTSKTSHAVRNAFLAATLTVATGGVLALGGGGIARRRERQFDQRTGKIGASHEHAC